MFFVSILVTFGNAKVTEDMSKPPHHQSFSSCSSRVSTCFQADLESRTVFFAVGLSFCGQLDCGNCIQVRFCAGKRSECVIHPITHTLRSPLRNTHTDTLSVWPKTHFSTCDHRICHRCSGTLTCDSMPPSRPQRDKRWTSACCPLISLWIETQWTSLNARVLWPVLSKGAEILRLTGHHSRCRARPTSPPL